MPIARITQREFDRHAVDTPTGDRVRQRGAAGYKSKGLCRALTIEKFGDSLSSRAPPAPDLTVGMRAPLRKAIPRPAQAYAEHNAPNG